MATSNLFCAICFEYYKSSDDILCSACGHVFHNDCFKDWMARSTTCPDCCVTNPQTHPIFLHIDDPSLSKKKLLQQLEESEQNFFSLHGALTATESKCTELNNEVQLQKAQIQSYEQELAEMKQTEAKDTTPDVIMEKDLEIARLTSLNNFLEKKLIDFKTRIIAIIGGKNADNNNVNAEENKEAILKDKNADNNNVDVGANKENINQDDLVHLKQLLNDLEIGDQAI